MFYRILFIVHYAHRRTIGLQRYNKKCTYASKASFFLKKNRASRSMAAFRERSYEIKKCLGWHFECSARQVPTLRISANIENRHQQAIFYNFLTLKQAPQGA